MADTETSDTQPAPDTSAPSTSEAAAPAVTSTPSVVSDPVPLAVAAPAAAPVPVIAPPQIGVAEWCTRRSGSDRRVEMLAGFHADMTRKGKTRDTAANFDQAYASFVSRPVA